MSRHRRFHLKDHEDLKAELDSLGLSLPKSSDLGVLGEPLPIGDREAPNRFVVHPMEGFDSNMAGTPQELTFRRYSRYAAGGAGLIWFEATAVMHEARSNPRQLALSRDNVDVFRRLVESTRKTAMDRHGREPVLVLQLTHSGRYSKPQGIPRPIIAHHSPILDPKHGLSPEYPLVTDEYLDRLMDTYVEAAALAASAGFDGVDIKSCHRYLVSELLASFERQDSRYGGSFENRTRLLCETLSRISSEVDGVFVTTRMNAFDAISYPYGFGVSREDYNTPDLAEPLKLVDQLKRIGVPVLNLSIGNPYFNPHYGRPYDFPISGIEPPDEHPLLGMVRFFNITREIQQANPDLPLIGTGYSWLRHLMPEVAAGVVQSGWATMIGQGRNSFAYPDSVSDILEKGALDPEKCCVTCSACTQIMRDAEFTGCVVRDSLVYGPFYRHGRRFAFDRVLDQARRCRNCEFANCTAGCPAHVDVPGFIRAFADGDIAKSYDILRASNVLPEMCAYVCPSEEQCEKGCLENIFTECAVPVRDIQLVVAKSARIRGLTGVRLPETGTGKSVAVVGAGPAGLACAIRLLELGHSVHVYDRAREPGGTPDGVIPGVRYISAREEVQAVFKPAVDAGRLVMHMETGLGYGTSLEELKAEHVAVFLATGLTGSSSLGSGAGVVDAVSFLRQVKTGEATETPEKVAVIGGGNTAMDAALTAVRNGSRDVYIVYRRSFAEMPAWPRERDEFLASGGHLLMLTQPVRYVHDDDGGLVGVALKRTVLGEPDESGRRKPVLLDDAESILKVDLVVEAMGQNVDNTLMPGVELTKSGLVKVAEDTFETSLDGVFAGGDMVNGGTTAVRGVAEGMKAAESIDALIGEK